MEEGVTIAKGVKRVSGFVYLLILKHHGATEGERDNIQEAKPDTDPRENF